MKKLILYIFFLFASSASLLSQITKTVGPDGDYPTLKDAFDVINAGTISGEITLQIIDNITEYATAELFESGYGDFSSYTSVTIYPTGSYTIDGDFDGPLILLNGADNVTIDGRNGGTTPDNKNLTITNINSTGTAASTIQFSESATNNTIKFCT